MNRSDLRAGGIRAAQESGLTCVTFNDTLCSQRGQQTRRAGDYLSILDVYQVALNDPGEFSVCGR
jgi:hypothetical protein